MTEEGTTRIPFITDRSDVPEEHRDHFDSIEESRGGIRGPFGVLLNSPEVAGRIGHLGAYIRFESVLPAAERELAILTTAREFDCAFEWAAHVPIARDAGVRDEAIDTLAHRNDLDALTETEAMIIRFGRDLFRDHTVAADTYDAAKAYYGNQGVTELTATMGYYSMMACVLNAFDVVPPSDAPTLPD